MECLEHAFKAQAETKRIRGRLLHTSRLRRQGDDVIAAAIRAANSLVSQCHQCWLEDTPLHADPWSQQRHRLLFILDDDATITRMCKEGATSHFWEVVNGPTLYGRTCDSSIAVAMLTSHPCGAIHVVNKCFK